MKRPCYGLLTALLVSCLTRLVLAQSINFAKGSWKDMLARAKSENKVIFVDVYTTWCGPCKMLDQRVFTDKEVAGVYNSYFINYKADAERGEGVSLAQKYGVRGYPTALFINGDGQLIDSWVGFVTAPKFKGQGERVFRKTPVGITLSLYDATYQAGERDSDFMRTYLRLRRRAGLPPTDLLDTYVRQLPADSLQTLAVTALLLEHTTVCHGPAFDALLSRTGDRRAESALRTVLENELTAAGEQRDKARLEQVCRAVERLEPADRVAECVAQYQLSYSALAEDWKTYARQAEAYTTRFLLPRLTADQQRQHPQAFRDRYDQLNNIGYFISKHGKDDAHLSAILTHLSTVGRLLETPSNTSLQACLQYRLGERDQAVALQNKALDLAKAAGEDASNYTVTLQRMQKKKSL